VSGPVLVGLLDSGAAESLAPSIAAASSFRLDERGAVVAEEPKPDRVGHGSSVAHTILAAAPSARLAVAQVFHASLSAPPAAVAEGLRWLVAQKVRLVNMSFGLAADRSVLRSACEAASHAGVILLAAAPARGAAVFPAAYECVLAVSGDARCTPGEVSTFDPGVARFGAHPRMADGAAAGASAAVAWVSGLVAPFLAAAPQADAKAVVRHLTEIARYRGRERRSRASRGIDQASPR
jgi:Subtilase family